MIYFNYIMFITIIFIIWVEYSVGGILFRPNSLGKISLNITSLFNFMINPLHNKFLWNLEIIDTNYIFILIVSSLLYFICN
jgi:hypothetical protein